MSSPARITPTFQFQANPLAQQQQPQQSPTNINASKTATANAGPPPLSLAAQSAQPSDDDRSSPRIPPQPQQPPITSPLGGPTSPSLSALDSLSLAPYRPAFAAPSGSTLSVINAPQLLNSSSRASSGSGQRSASPQPPQSLHQRKPTLSRMSSMGDRNRDRTAPTDDTDRTPLLGAMHASQQQQQQQQQLQQNTTYPLEVEDGCGHSGDSSSLTKGLLHATAAPVPAPSPSTAGGGGGVGGGVGQTPGAPIGANSYYEQYEATVNRIRARRAAESAAAKDNLLSTPERRAREYRVVGGVFSLVILCVGLLIYFLYPRVPLWTITAVQVDSLRLWSDGTVAFSITSIVGVSNSNFVMTGIESVSVGVLHNGTHIGSTKAVEELTNLKWPARASTQIILTHDFSTVPADKFQAIFNELSGQHGSDPNGGGGRLTLQYEAAIVTSENFRLRNLQVYCTAHMVLDPIPVPPRATITDSHCQHTERTG